MSSLTGRARRRDGERGAAAVEFGLLLPILLLIVLGIAEFGRAYNVQVSLSAAAREGARVLALDIGDADAATRDAAPSLDSGAMGVTTSGCAAPGGSATVTATYSLEPFTPLLGNFIGSPFELTGIGVMRCGG